MIAADLENCPLVKLNAVHRTPHPRAGTRVRSAVCRLRVKGAGLLHTEPEERRPVLWSELKADAAVDHRYGIRVQGEGCGAAVTSASLRCFYE